MIIELAMRAWIAVLDGLLRGADCICAGIAWAACTLFWLLVLPWIKD